MIDNKKITVNEAAAILGSSPQTIREGLKAGVLPFGIAYKPEGNQNWRYMIYPEKFKEFVGGH